MTLAGDEQITGFQLRDVLDATRDLSTARLRIQAKVSQNRAFAEDTLKEAYEVGEEEKKTR